MSNGGNDQSRTISVGINQRGEPYRTPSQMSDLTENQRQKWTPVGGYPSVEEQVEEQRRHEDKPPRGMGYYAKFTPEERSLRDWFAGQALTSLDPSCHDAQQLASTSYAIADAMLEERKR